MTTSKRMAAAQMIARTKGRLYDANFDRTILEALDECKELCYDYNQMRPTAREERGEFLRTIVGSMGSHATIVSPFWCDYGANIHLGENFYANHGLVILDGAPVTFGDNVFIAPNCVFSTAGHPIDAPRRNEGLEYALPISVGDDVWFGMGVLVCPGVTIGSNVVVGAGSVVTRDIPSGVVAVGNPCHVLRPITIEDAQRYERWARD
ncbi:MAG: sugar O-acetyltransferase [Coriobacteriales bacterium]|nr:sugar O-acetyltransferase [Coriobacteriales bacterium]